MSLVATQVGNERTLSGIGDRPRAPARRRGLGDDARAPRRRRGAGSLAVVCLGLLACSDSAPPPDVQMPQEFRGRTVYEIFLRSFADSNGDGHGDLAGLTAHLDYLNDGNAGSTSSLGVDAIWLMPVFPSPSYHGYDVTDYRGINPQYGTLADFDAMIAAAHARGIRVLLDMVVNHSSSQHPWFIDASTGATAAKRNYYSWRDVDPHWSRPWDQADPWHAKNASFYYGLFCDCMPDLNLAEPAVTQELIDAMEFWLARGVDGFRLDAVRYLFESSDGALADQTQTHAWLKQLRSTLAAAAPKMVLVGEAWAPVEVQASYYGQGDELQLAFSFDLAEALKSSALAGDATAVVNLLARSQTAISNRSFEAPFLSNHDQVRVMRAVGANPSTAKVAAAALMAMPGTPFIYYGEEIGMQGASGSSDEAKRTPMHWTSAAPGFGFSSGRPWYPMTAESPGIDVTSQQNDQDSLWRAYRDLIAVRRASPVLQTGDASWLKVSGGAGLGVFALLRTSDAGRVLFVANFGRAVSGAFSVPVQGTPAPLLAKGSMGAPSGASGSLSFPGLGPQGYAFFTLK